MSSDEDHEHSENIEPSDNENIAEEDGHSSAPDDEFGSSLLDDAVRDALAGPAREIAEDIARSAQLSYFPGVVGSSLLDDAVRDSLAGPAREIAKEISQSSLAWLRNYSTKAIEPVFFSDIAHALADQQLKSSESEYEPIRVENVTRQDISNPAEIFEHYEITVKSLQGLLSEIDRLAGKLTPFTVSFRGQANADWGLHSTLYRVICRGCLAEGFETGRRW